MRLTEVVGVLATAKIIGAIAYCSGVNVRINAISELSASALHASETGPVFQRDMMPLVRPTVGRLLAAILLALCIGVQVLEASGKWDRALEDTSDEAIIVVVVLCIGAAVAKAGTLLARVRLSRIASHIVLTAMSPSVWPSSLLAISSSYASPPVSLRI
jgi:hypothetical protein